MDQGWRRFHLLLVFLAFWKPTIGHASLNSNPRSFHYQKFLKSDASPTGNAPLKAGSNMLAVNGPSSLSQFVGGASSSYESMSQTQSSPSDSVSASWSQPQNLPKSDSLSSLLQLQGSSSSSPQDMASQSAGAQGSYSQYDFTYKDRTGLQPGVSGQLVSTRGSSFSQAIPESFSMSSQLYSQGSGASQFLGSSGQQAPGSPAHAKLLSSSKRLSSQVTSMRGSPSQYPSISQDSSRLKWSGSSGQFVSAPGGSASLSGLSAQSQSTSSQYAPAYSSPGFSPIAASSPSTSKTWQFLSPSDSQGGFVTSRLSSLAQGVSSSPVGSYVQSEGSPSQTTFGSPQYVGAPMAAAQTTSSQYNQTSAQSLSQSQIPQKWQSSSFSQGSQTSGVALSQSRLSAQSASAPSKSFASVGRPSQSAPASLYYGASLPSPQSGYSQFSQATDSALSQSKAPQRWQPSVSSFSQGNQTSGAALSQSRFSVPSKSFVSVGRPSQSAPASLYYGASLPSPQSGYSHYSQATDSALSQSKAPQRWQPSVSSFSQGNQTSGAALSQSRFSAQSASDPSKSFASVGRPSQSAPASLYYGASLPSPQSGYSQFSQATDSALSQSKVPQRWQPSVSSFSQGNQTSGAALSQSRFSVPSKSFVSVGRPSQSAPASLYYGASLPSPQSGYSHYSQATDSALSQSKAPQRWQPSVSSFSQGNQTSGAALSQSRFSAQSASDPSKSFASVGRPSQSAPASLYYGASLPSPQSGYSQFSQATDSALSQSKVPQRWQPSVSSFSQGSQTSGAALSQSRLSAQSASAPSKSFASVGGPSQSAPASLSSSASMPSPQSGSSHYSQATYSALSQSKVPQRWQPSVSSFSQGSQTSGAALSQSRFSVPSKSFVSVGGPSQSAPASLSSSASMPSPQSGSSQYSQATDSALYLSQSQAPQRWQPSVPLSSPGFQTSSTVGSQISPSQGTKFPIRYFLASGSGPSQLVSTQGASSYGDLAQSPSSSPLYAPAYSKTVSSPSVSSQFASGQSLYASSLAGTALGASSRYAAAQRGTGFNIGSLQPQVAAGQYVPAPLGVKVPAYSQATPGVSSMSPSLQSYYTWQSTTSKGADSSFPTSGAAVMQSSSSPQSVQGSSRFSSIAGSTSRLLSTQSRGSFHVSPSVSTVGQYTPGYAKFGTSPLGVSSQSASDQTSSRQYLPLSTTGAGGQLTSSSGYLSAQGASGSSVGSAVLSQGVLTKDVLVPLDTSMPVSQTAEVSSGVQASGAAAFQSGSSQSSQASSSLFSLPSLSSNVDSGTASSQMSPGLISFRQPTGFMIPSSGSSVQAASGGVFSASSQAQTLSGPAGFGTPKGQGVSGGSASVLSGSYDSSIGQGAPVSKPSRGSLSRYYGVKG